MVWYHHIACLEIGSLKTQFSFKIIWSTFIQVSDVSVGNMKLELLIERCLLSAKLIKISESYIHSIICFWLNWFVDLPLHSIFWTWKAGLLFSGNCQQKGFFWLGSKMQLWWKIINTKLWFIPTTVKVCLYYNYASLQ